MALANQIGLSNKYVSERHAKAELAGKLTAGDANKICKKNNIKTSAKEIVKMFELHYGYLPEWHHSGFYNGNQGRTMGRTYFFTIEQIEEIIANWNEILRNYSEIKLAEEKENKIQKNTLVQGVFYEWAQAWGDKKKHKKLCIYEGNKFNRPTTFIELSDDEMKCAKLLAGKKYYGWNEPSKSDFTIEIYNDIIEKQNHSEK